MLYWLIKIGHTSLMHRLRDRSESTLVSKVCTRLAGMLQDVAQSDAGRLPPERLLAQQLGVSRTVMREATKRLESQGLLEIRHGSGTWVINQLHKPVCGSLSLAMPKLKERLRQLNEARLLVEPEIARQAAARRRKSHLSVLAKCQQALSDSSNTSAAVEADIAFHRALARAPRAEETARLQRLLADKRAFFSQQPEAARELVAVLSSAADHPAPGELAATFYVTHTLLNLDECVTKP
jgi:GntR family transcriptional repressor for pyruvate dehydrogenase complex